jgi:hypothetical protein
MNYSRNGTPFGLPMIDRSFYGAPIGAGVPVLDQDINIMQSIQVDRIRGIVDALFYSGWKVKGTIGAYGSNTLRITRSEFILNGLHSIWDKSFTINNNITFASAGGSPRYDLLWIEMWLEEITSTGTYYPYGNVDYYTTSPYANDIVDPIFGDPYTNRVQIRYRTRITQDVELLTDAGVIAQGAKISPGSATFSYDANKRCWVSATGDLTYSCVDGKVFALPILKVLRPAGDDNVTEGNTTDLRDPILSNFGSDLNAKENYRIAETIVFRTPDENVFLGVLAGEARTTGLGNTFLGKSSGKSSEVGNNNVFVGRESGRDNLSNNNLMVGAFAGRTNVAGQGNVFLGYHSAYSSPQGSYNLFAGLESGYVNEGDFNVFLGPHAGYSNTTGTKNLFVCRNAGFSNTTGKDNIFSGYNSGKSNILGDENVFIGNETGYSNLNSGNVFIGHQAGYANTNGFYNLYLGHKAGYNATSGTYTIAIGNEAGANNTGNANVFLGSKAGNANISGDDNVFLGRDAGQLCNDDGNVIVGSQAGYNKTSGINNVFLGRRAAYTNATGNENFVGGYAAAYGGGGGDGNIIIGAWAGYSNTNGSYNVFMGRQAGYTNTDGDSNVIIGRDAGYSLVVNDDNVFLGKEAGYNAIGQRNVFIGHQAGYGETGNNKLHIANVYPGNPLIGGDFAGRYVSIDCLPSGDFSLEVNGKIGPHVDNASDLGKLSKRFQDIYATNGVIQTSDIRDKESIKDSPLGLAFISALRPISFKWKNYITPKESTITKSIEPKIHTTKVTQPIYEIKKIGDRYVQVASTKVIEIKEPLFEMVPLYNEEGIKIGRHRIPILQEKEITTVSEGVKNKFSRTHYGLLAQEVEDVLKDMSISTNDFAGLIKDKETGKYGLRTGEFIPPIIQAIKELKNKIEKLYSIVSVKDDIQGSNKKK